MPRTSDPIDVYVGTRVRARRKQLSMSQTILADGLGVSFQQVQKYEKGTNRISAARLARIAEMLQVPVPYFYEGAPDSQRMARHIAQDAAFTEFLSRQGRLLVNACNKLPAPDLSTVIAFAQALAKKAVARPK
jgi:transcriptional regulator with XRE-family HTH domain